MMDPGAGLGDLIVFRSPVFRSILLSTLFLRPAALPADEGMWPFDNLPLQRMEAAYGFAPDQAWLDHLRLATVRFAEEGSGAFVGNAGLVLTNHHVAHALIQGVSARDRDLVKQGFVARNREQEIRVPGLELQVLVSMEDITGEVARAARSSGRAAALDALRRREAARTGLSCELVEFYQGGEYWIYGYRTFKDVRLVMAPEYDVAAFGKEWDNFTYPRHDLDFSLFRVYENGRPHRPEQTLAWSRQGVPLGGMTFVAGHPGRTNRLEAWAQMDFRRRIVNPLVVRTLERKLKVLAAYSAHDAENARRVSMDILEAANFLKVYREEIRGLEEPQTAARLQAAERDLRTRIDRLPRWRDQAGRSWSALERILRQQEALAREYQLLHRTYGSLERGPLARALKLVRLVAASGPEDETRREARAELLEACALNRELETMLLASGLEETREWLGESHPLTRLLLGGSGPQELASQALQWTRIDDPAYVRELIEGGPRALAACRDPLILLAARLEPRSREVKRQYQALEAELGEHNARIVRARFALQGKAACPDATFTLRLSYGAVRTYPAEGTLQPPFTTFGGLFDRADAWGPTAEAGSWALPPRWLQRRKAIDPAVPLNFITTNDITGGHSGSPVVDRDGELVGLVFDGNLHNIPGRFLYDERRNRCIAVDARAILEALAKVYDADHLVRELTEK